MSAIRKFNRYCEKLASLHESEWTIPLPDPLPTTLSGLRDGHILMEDVWISKSSVPIPRWLEDLDVREGIRAMLKKERCVEEARKLGLEADNICRWFGKEYLAVEIALATPSSESFMNFIRQKLEPHSNTVFPDCNIQLLLRQRQQSLIHLRSSWINPLASSVRFDWHITSAQRTVALMTSAVGVFPQNDIVWVSPVSNKLQWLTAEQFDGEELEGEGANQGDEECVVGHGGNHDGDEILDEGGDSDCEVVLASAEDFIVQDILFDQGDESGPDSSLDESHSDILQVEDVHFVKALPVCFVCV